MQWFWQSFEPSGARHNKQFKQTLNAWHFWFALGLVFTVQCGK
ncbi:DUF3265 domain-containing protein [Vibrio vulnificus]